MTLLSSCNFCGVAIHAEDERAMDKAAKTHMRRWHNLEYSWNTISVKRASAISKLDCPFHNCNEQQGNWDTMKEHLRKWHDSEDINTGSKGDCHRMWSLAP
jgi:hypothetical protein